MKYLSSTLAVVLVSIALNHSPARAATNYVTSTGASFTKVYNKKLGGNVWRADGLPGQTDGTIWSKDRGDFFTNEAITPDQDGLVTESEATRECSKMGATLPTCDDFRRLISYFENDGVILTPQGQKDFIALFPDAGNHWFWSITVDTRLSENACALAGSIGFLNVDNRGNYDSVRCISH